jgi:succinate dehydrogenase flavin-adding protein (antitoxin of CptAB toxin-antitoxin module)
MLAIHLRKYFWDTDFKSLNEKQHEKYIAERILELGDEKAVHWLIKRYPASRLKKIASSSRQLSAKSKNFWKLIFSRI